MKGLICFSLCLSCFGIRLSNKAVCQNENEITKTIENHLYELTGSNGWEAEELCLLKSADEFYQFSYYSLKESESSGYLIYDNEASAVVEFSTVVDRLANCNAEIKQRSDLYYFGPSMLYERMGDELYNISDSHDRFSVTDIKSTVRNAFVNSVPGSELFMPSSTVWAILPYTLPNYSYNPTNICGATAAAMMLRYMDLHFNNNFVPSSLESTNGVTLIQHLATYVQFITGSSAGTQSSGINAYLQNKVSYSTYATYLYDYVTYGSITNGRPYIVNVNGHPTYGNHAMTAYAYSDNWPVVNDGWGNTSIYINPGYTSGIVVFN